MGPTTREVRDGTCVGFDVPGHFGAFLSLTTSDPVTSRPLFSCAVGIQSVSQPPGDLLGGSCWETERRPSRGTSLATRPPPGEGLPLGL